MKTPYKHNSFKKEWITNGITQEVVDWAEGFGEYLCDLTPDKYGNLKTGSNSLTTGQLRKFFGEVKRIEPNIVKNRNDLEMLKPMLAYAVGRAGRDNRIKDFHYEISTALNSIRRDEQHIQNDFNNFVQIFEAIVAYHKYYGGKENKN